MTIIKKTFDGTWVRGAKSPGKVSWTPPPPPQAFPVSTPPKKLTQKSKNIIKKLEGRGFQTVT